MIFSYGFPTGEINIDLSLHLSILSIYLSVFKLNDLWIFYNLRWNSHIIAILLDDFSRNCKKKANGMNYYGKTNVTKSGSPCNYWADTSQKATPTRIWRTSSTTVKTHLVMTKSHGVIPVQPGITVTYRCAIDNPLLVICCIFLTGWVKLLSIKFAHFRIVIVI